MTEEEEKAIEYFKEHIKYFKEQIKFIETVDCDYYDEEYELYKNRVKQFEIILNLIERLKAESEKKDKIIDLILQDLMVCGGLDFIDIGKSDGNFAEDKQKLKQHYERKVENGNWKV